MKAIAIKTGDGLTEFLPYKSEEIVRHFRKLCNNSGMSYVETEDDFEDLKDMYIELGSPVKFNGPGVYDREGLKHEALVDSGGTSYVMVNFSQVTEPGINIIKMDQEILNNYCLN